VDEQPLHVQVQGPPVEGSPGQHGWSTAEGTRFWQGLVAGVLQDLFNVKADVRRAAGRQLLLLLVAEDDAAAAAAQQEEEDAAGESSLRRCCHGCACISCI